MNLLNDINAFLLTKLTPYAPIGLEVFPGDSSEEIMARNDPNRATETRYLDGSRVGRFSFSYYAKSVNSETARLQLEAIIAALDFAELTPINGAASIKLEAATTPAFVTKTDAGEVVFVSSLALEYHTGG